MGPDLIGFTITAGVAQACGADLDAFAGILMQRADEALYVAKQRGRAQAAAWADAMEPVSSTFRRNHGGARPF